jgi:MFS family permease
VINNKLPQHNKNEPRYFYGYIIVIASFFILMLTFGIFMTFGVFFKPLQAEFGWSSAMTSGPFSLSMIVSGAMSIAMGKFNDRFGPRLVITISGFLIGLGYLLMSQVSTLWQLYLFLGVIIGIGIGGTWVPVMSTVARWFVRKRNQITGIVIVGAGLAGLIGPLVLSRLIEAHGWQLSYAILGITVLIGVILAAQFLRRDPAQVGQMPDGEIAGENPEMQIETGAFSLNEAIRTAQFWITFVMFICFGICMFGVQVHIVPHATELGNSPISAANLLSVNLGTSILSNYLIGSLGDRIGNRRVFLIGFLLMAASLFWLVFAGEMWMLYIFSMIFGFAHGGMATSESPIVAWLFGLKSHGLIYGAVGFGFTIGASLGPVIIGYIFDLTGRYNLAFLACTAVGISGIILTIILRPTKKPPSVESHQ